MTNPTPKRPPGRPLGWTKEDQPKAGTVHVSLTQTALDWIKSKPRGWLPNLVEDMARRK